MKTLGFLQVQDIKLSHLGRTLQSQKSHEANSDPECIIKNSFLVGGRGGGGGMPLTPQESHTHCSCNRMLAGSPWKAKVT